MASVSTSGMTGEERGPPTVAIGGASSSSNNNGSSNGSNNGSGDTSSTKRRKRAKMGKGRWTRQEHSDFLDGLERYGKQWTAIAQLVKTRTTVQTRTHHGKYVMQLSKRQRLQAK